MDMPVFLSAHGERQRTSPQSSHKNPLEQKLELFIPLLKILQQFSPLTQNKKQILGHGLQSPASPPHLFPSAALITLSFLLILSTHHVALASGSLHLRSFLPCKALSPVSCLTPSPTVFREDFSWPRHLSEHPTLLSVMSNLLPCFRSLRSIYHTSGHGTI